MSVIRLSTLGGLVPSATIRGLPENGAQVAHNLLASTSAFRPLLNNSSAATTTVINPKTLHRLARKVDGAFNSDMSSGWIARADAVNYVKGQVNDDDTERTYYTFADGSAPPRAMDVKGVDKPLGVPAPSLAPTGTVTKVYSYTPDVRTAELITAGGKIADILRANVVWTWVGIDSPTYANIWARPGYITLVDPTDPKFENPERAKAFRVFQVNAVRGTTIVNTFSSFTAPTTPIEPNTGLFDPAMGGFYGVAAGNYSPPTGSWATYGAAFYVIPVYAYAPTLTFNTAAVVSAMRAIKMPGTNGAKQLFTDDQTTALCNWLVEYAGKDSALIKPKITALKTSFESFMTTVDSGRISSVDYVVQRQEELKGLYQAVVDAYDKVNADLLNLLEQFYRASGVDSVVPPGVPAIIEDRFYVCTYVTAWGEESAPSPVSELAELDDNDTVTGYPPNPPSGYGITKYRYYRTNTSSDSAQFQFVAEVPFSAASLAGLSTTPTVDTKKSTELGEVCPTTTWIMPPSNLRGLVAGANGMMAGFFGNTVCFCEPYVPYAWPAEYRKTTEYPVVGIGVFDQTFVVCTQGNPYFMAGADSASINSIKTDAPYACSSARSIASGEGGVIYASPDGLCLADRTGVRLATDALFKREDWQKLDPTSILAELHENVYYFQYSGNSGGCYALHLESSRLTSLDMTATAFYRDTLTDRLYAANGTSIVALFAGATYRTATYRTGIVTSGAYTTFAWVQVQSAFTAPVVVRWYGEGALIDEVTVTDRAPVRLALGRYLEHEIEIVSSGRVDSVTVASSTEELQKI